MSVVDSTLSAPSQAWREERAGCWTCPVRGVGICSVLEDDDLQNLDAIQDRVRYRTGQTIVHQGDPANYMYRLIEGSVRLTRQLADGRRAVTGFLMAGDILGYCRTPESVFIHSAEAMEPATLCRLSGRRFDALSGRFPRLNGELLSWCNDELIQAQSQLLLLGRATPKERLASFLLRLHRQQTAAICERAYVTLPMRRMDIADYLGMSVETVSRNFTWLRRRGYIALPTPAVVVLRDPEALRELAG